MSGYDPGSGRAARAVRGRGGRLRAALWRLRDAPRAPRGTALLPVHCCHSSLFVGSVFRNGSQCFASGATCRPSRIVALCRAAMRRYAPVRGSRYGSLWFGSPGSGVRRFASPSPAGGVTRPDMARILPGPRSGNTGPSRFFVSLCRALSRAGDLQRSRPPLQWNGCRVCCVAFALFRIGRDFFREPGRLPGAGARIRAG